MKIAAILVFALSFACIVAAHAGGVADTADSADLAMASGLPDCTGKQLAGLRPSGKDIETHREFVLPHIAYPFDPKRPSAAELARRYRRGDRTPEFTWNIDMQMVVNASGVPVCLQLMRPDWADVSPLNDARRAVLQAVRTWRYAPFSDADGKPVEAIVNETVAEHEEFSSSRHAPKVPLSQVRITLQRGACFGFCQAYQVQIDGDGRVVYQGRIYAVVPGTHSYRIDPKQVARLVASMDEKNLWQSRTEYKAGATDGQAQLLALRLGKRQHTILDYLGTWAGMPQSIKEFEEQVDAVAQTGQWLTLSGMTLESLKAEHFDFHGRLAGQILSSSMERASMPGDKVDEHAVIELIRLGAPLDVRQASVYENPHPHYSALEPALHAHLDAVVDHLLIAGALNTRGKIDQGKIDAAFVAAVESGRLDAVEKIWNVAGSTPHPSLAYPARIQQGRLTKTIMIPVTQALRNAVPDEQGWQGKEIAKWLIEHGCHVDVNIPGTASLLEFAVDTEDADFVRYILAQGADPAVPASNGFTLAEFGYSEDIKMLLLETAPSAIKDRDVRRRLREQSEQRRYTRVLAWLEAHDGD